MVRNRLPLQKAAESARGFRRMVQTACPPRLPCRAGIVLVCKQLAFDRFNITVELCSLTSVSRMDSVAPSNRFSSHNKEGS